MEKRIASRKRTARIIAIGAVLYIGVLGIVLWLLDFSLSYEGVYLDTQQNRLKYYSQQDSRWGEISYGDGYTLAQAGCAPTTIAMVVASIADENITPVEVADWAKEERYLVGKRGSYLSMIPDYLLYSNIRFDQLAAPKEEMEDLLNDILDRGNLALLVIKVQDGNHMVILRGRDGDKVLIANSASLSDSRKAVKLSTLVDKLTYDLNGETNSVVWEVYWNHTVVINAP